PDTPCLKKVGLGAAKDGANWTSRNQSRVFLPIVENRGKRRRSWAEARRRIRTWRAPYALLARDAPPDGLSCLDTEETSHLVGRDPTLFPVRDARTLHDLKKDGIH